MGPTVQRRIFYTPFYRRKTVFTPLATKAFSNAFGATTQRLAFLRRHLAPGCRGCSAAFPRKGRYYGCVLRRRNLPALSLSLPPPPFRLPGKYAWEVEGDQKEVKTADKIDEVEKVFKKVLPPFLYFYVAASLCLSHLPGRVGKIGCPTYIWGLVCTGAITANARGTISHTHYEATGALRTRHKVEHGTQKP